MTSNPKIAILLAGSGNRDGSEIHESVCTLLILAKKQIPYQCFAPDEPQKRVVNHKTGVVINETRNMLAESARIARGAVEPLQNLKASDFSAVIIPGGGGAITYNLSNFAEKGADCTIHPEVARVIEEFHKAKKPIGAICIAPILVAKVLGKHKVEVTFGTSDEMKSPIEKMGAKLKKKEVTEAYTDIFNKVVSTPAYMEAKNIVDVYTGIEKLVEMVLKL